MSRKNLLISRNNVEDITWKFGVFFPVPDDFQAVRSIGQVNQISDYLETVRPWLADIYGFDPEVSVYEEGLIIDKTHTDCASIAFMRAQQTGLCRIFPWSTTSPESSKLVTLTFQLRVIGLSLLSPC